MLIKTDLINVSDSHRQVNEKTVEMLAVSMDMVGLLQPITVSNSKLLRGTYVDGYLLVAGNHRLHAARALGWDEIEATILDDTLGGIRLELIEIDENLCRSDLTASQRAIAIKRRKEIWEALNYAGNSGQGSPIIPVGRPKEFASETSSITGEAKRTINQHLSRADELGEDLHEVYGTSLDTGVELDALKKIPEVERKALIAEAKTGAVVTARKPMARISLKIDYLDINQGAELIAEAIMRKELALAVALHDELGRILSEVA